MESGHHPPPTDPYALVGTTLADKYRIDGVLGEGGFGVVYSGSHLVIGARVAIKRLKPLGLSSEDQARANEGFLREAKMLFSLTHPSIVRLYDVGTVTGAAGTVPYVVLEYLDGGSLEHELAARRVDGRHFTLLDFQRVFQPVLEGMAYVHENGIAHRDLKPSNIMLIHPTVRAATAKVVDFGIARWVADGVLTSTTSPMFTPAYGAPEQWDPSFGPTGTRTDVYALALIMAEALLLAPMRTGMGPAQIFREVLQSRKLDFDSARPDLPPELGAILETALSVKPEDRFENAGELLAALAAVLPTPESRPSLEPGVPTPRPVLSPASSASTLLAPPERSSSSGSGASKEPRSGERSEQLPPRASPGSGEQLRRLASPRVLTLDDDHLTAVWGPVFLTVWKKVTRPDYARSIQFAVRDLAHSVPNERVACLTIIEEKAELPNAESRTAVANIFRFNLEHIVCSANVMEGEGFRAAAVRGVVTGIALVARQPFPNHVFSSVSQAARWIAQAFAKEGDHVTASRLSASDLIDAVDQVRRGSLSVDRGLASSDGI
jgi:serine/threonine-protein kinase